MSFLFIQNLMLKVRKNQRLIYQLKYLSPLNSK